MSQLVGRGTERSGVRFPTLVMSRSRRQASHHTLPLSTQQWWAPSARIQGWIDVCWLRPCDSIVPGGKEAAEHVCMKEDYKPVPLPFYLFFDKSIGFHPVTAMKIWHLFGSRMWLNDHVIQNGTSILTSVISLHVCNTYKGILLEVLIVQTFENLSHIRM